MFDYKAARNLVGFIGIIKTFGMILVILVALINVAYGFTQYFSAMPGEENVIWVFVVFLAIFGGAFWTAVVWAVFGLFQHHLAAVSYTAFRASQNAVPAEFKQ